MDRMNSRIVLEQHCMVMEYLEEAVTLRYYFELNKNGHRQNKNILDTILQFFHILEHSPFQIHNYDCHADNILIVPSTGRICLIDHGFDSMIIPLRYFCRLPTTQVNFSSLQELCLNGGIALVMDLDFPFMYNAFRLLSALVSVLDNFKSYYSKHLPFIKHKIEQQYSLPDIESCANSLLQNAENQTNMGCTKTELYLTRQTNVLYDSLQDTDRNSDANWDGFISLVSTSSVESITRSLNATIFTRLPYIENIFDTIAFLDGLLPDKTQFTTRSLPVDVYLYNDAKIKTRLFIQRMNKVYIIL